MGDAQNQIASDALGVVRIRLWFPFLIRGFLLDIVKAEYRQTPSLRAMHFKLRVVVLGVDKFRFVKWFG